MKHSLNRIIAAALCALTLVFAVPALAFPSMGTVIVSTPIYASVDGTATNMTLNNGQVQILGQEGNYYKITVGQNGYDYGYIPTNVVTVDTGTTTTTTTAGGTTPSSSTTPAGTPGYITGVKNDAPLRSEPSKSGALLENVTVNSTVSILGYSGDYTQVATASGKTGYILSKYVASGSAGSSSSSGSAASADTVMLEAPVTMVSIAKTIYLRKTPSSSTKSANLVKKLTGMKGKAVQVLGSAGSEYLYVSANGYTGYAKSVDLTPAATGAAAQASYATGDKAQDKWGEIVKIDGTNIGSAYGKLYDNNIYCNGLNSKGSDFYYNAYSGKKNYFYMFSPQNAGVHVLMSHNMQSSKTGGHYLHHVQNAWLGKSKCEKGCSIDSAAKTSTFYITYANHTQWQLVAFFEGSAAMRNTFAQNYTATGAQKASLISQFLGYSTSAYKGAVIGSAAETDDIMVFITCGDKGSKGGTFLCMLLKGA